MRKIGSTITKKEGAVGKMIGLQRPDISDKSRRYMRHIPYSTKREKNEEE